MTVQGQLQITVLFPVFSSPSPHPRLTYTSQSIEENSAKLNKNEKRQRYQ